jgi:hypothetical protein
MAKRSKGSALSTRIPIYTLSSGVGKQAPSKRLPTEAENIDNAFVTLEKSISKRAGYSFLPDKTLSTYDLSLEILENPDMWFYWFEISDDITYLICIDYNPTQSLLRIFKITSDRWENITANLGGIPQEVHDYLTYRPMESITAKEALRAVTVGQNIIILNRYVKAGFSSDDAGPAADLAGNVSTKFQLISGGSNFIANEVYTTTSTNGSGLEVRVNVDTTNTITSINSIVSAGEGYTLNEIVTISNNNPDGTDALIRILDPMNTGFGFDGSPNSKEDIKGRRIDYYTTTTQDPEGKATEFNQFKDYLSGDKVIYDAGSGRKIYECIKDVDPSTAVQLPTVTEYWTEKYDAKLLLIQDWVYPDTDNPELGQAIADFSKISFPPLDSDMFANNGYTLASNDRTELTLKELYPTTGSTNGKGKIYFASGSYLSALPGYYRIISFNPDSGGSGRPYTQRVRTPDKHSYIDQNRMPIQLSVVSEDSFEIGLIDWEPRTTGTVSSNPGPTIFKSSNKKSIRQLEINSLAFYRGRLFLSAADTLFSSRIGEYNNLWINDPSNITAADPLDLQASSNKYSRINAMIPFADYLFINTDSDTQFELLGSENQITPFTAELAPTSFYSTSPLVDPVLMGSQIYFAAPQKLYIYFSSQAANLNTAIEVSTHCPGYLPQNFGDITVAGSRNTIFLSDADNKNHLYGYTNRFQGDQVAQNALYRWIIGTDAHILSTSFKNDYLYCLLSLPYSTNTTSGRQAYIVRFPLTDEALTKPRIDNRIHFTVTADNTNYDPGFQETTFTVPIRYLGFDQCILYEGWDEENYSVIPILSQSISTGNQNQIKVSGDYSTVGNTIHFGNKFNMNIELSPTFYRDQSNNVIDGVLSLRTMHLRHFETGNYKIIATRRGRNNLTTTFNSQQIGVYNQTLPLSTYETTGETVAKIMAFSHEASISIQSDSPTPCNITNIELKGKFKPVYSSLDK